MIISDKTQIAERQSTAAYYDTVLPCVFSGTKGLDVGSRLINLVLLQPPWFCRGCLFFLERDGQGGSFSFFPGVLHGSFSFSGLDFFSFAGRRVDFFPLQGGLLSFAGVDFFLLQGGLGLGVGSCLNTQSQYNLLVAV